jgi:hypothetical protein
MITFKIKGVEYSIPDRATEITISQYLRLSETTDIQQQLRILANLPDYIELDELSLAKLGIMAEYFINGVKLPETDLKPLDLQDEPFGTSHYCYQAIETQSKHDAAILILCYVYGTEDWTNNKRPKLHEKHFDKYCNVPAWQYLPIIANYIEQLNEMRKLWNKALASTPTAEEVQAGISELNKFGMYGVLINIAGKDLEKYDRLYNRKWFEILLYLTYQKKENDFSKKYQKILTKKK